jgi:hypothetical protein
MSQTPEIPEVPSEPDDRLIPTDDQENADIERARAWLEESREKTGRNKCPVCDADSWQIGGPVALPAYRRDLGSAVIPVFTLTCSTCGNMLLLNAIYPNYLLADPVDETPGEAT